MLCAVCEGSLKYVGGKLVGMRKYLTVREVAAYFNVSERTVYNWVEAGYLRALKIYGEGTKGTIRIPLEAIEEFERTHYTLPPEVPLFRKRS